MHTCITPNQLGPWHAASSSAVDALAKSRGRSSTRVMGWTGKAGGAMAFSRDRAAAVSVCVMHGSWNRHSIEASTGRGFHVQTCRNWGRGWLRR